VSDDAILVSIDPRGAATLTLNRPEVHNAFDDLLIRGFTRKLAELDADNSVRVVVLAARGKSFSAGADLNWMRRMSEYSETENREDARRLAALMQTLYRLRKPTVARIQGAAFGGGVGLIACCDVAVAAAGATFSLSEIKLGLVPAVISPYVVRAMGERHARRYMLTAERFDAAEALRTGLIHEVVDAGALVARVDALVTQLLGNGPHAMAAVKSLIERVSGGAIDEAMVEETAIRIASVRASAEGRQGVAAFLEKRPPAWRKD